MRHSLYVSTGKAQKFGFHVLVSKYLQCLYLMLLIEAMPRCTFIPITTTVTKLHILVTKMSKTLILTIFDNFRYFDMTSVMSSQSRHTWGCWYLFGINSQRRSIANSWTPFIGVGCFLTNSRGVNKLTLSISSEQCHKLSPQNHEMDL